MLTLLKSELAYHKMMYIIILTVMTGLFILFITTDTPEYNANYLMTFMGLAVYSGSLFREVSVGQEERYHLMMKMPVSPNAVSNMNSAFLGLVYLPFFILSLIHIFLYPDFWFAHNNLWGLLSGHMLVIFACFLISTGSDLYYAVKKGRTQLMNISWILEIVIIGLYIYFVVNKLVVPEDSPVRMITMEIIKHPAFAMGIILLNTGMFFARRKAFELRRTYVNAFEIKWKLKGN